MPKTRRTRRAGLQAKGHCFLKFLDPSEVIQQTWPNDYQYQRRGGFVVTGREQLTRKNRTEWYYRVIHPDDAFGRQTFTIPAKNFVISDEGPEDLVFRDVPVEQPAPTEVNPDPVLEEPDPLLPFFLDQEDIQNLIAQGVEVDDDNEPAEENVPRPGDDTHDIFLDWGFNGIDCRASCPDISNMDARFTNIESDMANHLPILSLFLVLFPVQYIRTVVIPQMNGRLEVPVTYGEFVVFIGIIMFTSCFSGYEQEDWWSFEPIAIDKGAPYRMHDYMTGSRFRALHEALFFTNREPPEYSDPFFHVRQMIDEWNSHMSSAFKPGWISCLDLSMMKWPSRRSCPGWMFVPRKSTPYGNVFHTLCCGLSGVMYAVELCMGRDRPLQIGALEFDNLGGKTIGLLLRMTRSIWNSGRMVIMDSGFCVLQALVELRKKGVFSSALIRKRKIWPKHVPGETIQQHMETKQLGEVDCLQGVMDGVPVHIFAMKDADYVCSIMSTCGNTNEVATHKTLRLVSDGEQLRVPRHFKYTTPFSLHFRYRHQVDDHNALRQGGLSIEEIYGTKDWTKRVFIFLLAVTEVNTYKMKEYLSHGQWKMDHLRFRRELSIAMMNNTLDNGNIATTRARTQTSEETVLAQHKHESKPIYTGRWKDNRWLPSHLKYLQGRCHFCQTTPKKKTRLYCSCNKAHPMCKNCFVAHVQGISSNI